MGGEFELVSGSVYKIKWTGHGETAKGFLHRVSPVETHVVTSVNTKNMKVDAIVWKSLPERSTDSPLPTTSSTCWRDSTDECIFSRFAATKIHHCLSLFDMTLSDCEKYSQFCKNIREDTT